MPPARMLLHAPQNPKRDYVYRIYGCSYRGKLTVLRFSLRNFLPAEKTDPNPGCAHSRSHCASDVLFATRRDHHDTLREESYIEWRMFWAFAPPARVSPGVGTNY